MTSRTGRNGQCKKCGATVFIGLSDDVAAHMAFTDPIPLSPVGEFIARATGRRTYALRRYLQGKSLHERDRWQIEGTPAGSRRSFRFDVYADHVCGTPLPAMRSAFRSPAPQGAPNEAPPF